MRLALALLTLVMACDATGEECAERRPNHYPQAILDVTGGPQAEPRPLSYHTIARTSELYPLRVRATVELGNGDGLQEAVELQVWLNWFINMRINERIANGEVEGMDADEGGEAPK